LLSAYKTHSIYAYSLVTTTA